MFMVVGGELDRIGLPYYKDPLKVTNHGKFETYQEAYDVWKALSFQHIDNAHMRFKIFELDMP